MPRLATPSLSKEKLKTLPALRTAAARMAAAWSVVLGTLPGEGEAVSMPEVMSAVERVVSREDLAAAVEAVAELLPQGPADGDDGDAALEEQRNGQWRYGTENGRHEVGRLRTVVRGHAGVITFPQFTSMTRPACQPR